MESVSDCPRTRILLSLTSNREVTHTGGGGGGESEKPSLFRVKQDMKSSEVFVHILISVVLIGYQKSY